MKTKKNCIVSSQRDKYHYHRFNFHHFSLTIKFIAEITCYSALLLFIEARLHHSRFTRHILPERESKCRIRLYSRARACIYMNVSRGKIQRVRGYDIYTKKKPRIYSRWIGYEDLGEIRALCWEQWCDGTSNAARKRK